MLQKLVFTFLLIICFILYSSKGQFILQVIYGFGGVFICSEFIYRIFGAGAHTIGDHLFQISMLPSP